MNPDDREALDALVAYRTALRQAREKVNATAKDYVNAPSYARDMAELYEKLEVAVHELEALEEEGKP